MKFLITVCAYCLITLILFGGPFQPIFLALGVPDRLGIPYWRIVAAIIVGATLLVYRRTPKKIIPDLLGPAFFIIMSISAPTFLIGICAEAIKSISIFTLDADHVEDHWFFSSLHNAPAEFQFFLHAAALKDCTPYAWSYRKLDFYVVPPDAAVNVLPRDWITRCGIIRTER